MICKAHRLTLAVALCVGALLLAVGVAAPAGAGNAASMAGAPPQVSAAPLNPAYLDSLADRSLAASPRTAEGHGLGGRPGPQDVFSTSGMPLAGIGDLGSLPETYDLRTLGRVTAVRNQGSLGTCWSFAATGSLESCLLTGETTNFAEDNMVLTSGFDNGGSAYNWGGNIYMSTAYLVRWGGPVNESEDAYGDGVTPPGLSPRKHVQDVIWIPPRSGALDNDAIKNAVMQYGGADVTMGWYDSAYKASTASYYYSGTSSTNHEVLIVGWNDNYAASNFATLPPGNGAFIVKNSWGTSWGSSGYFYASYYDTRFGRASNPTAVFDGAESTSNYTGIYQYDPLGDCNDLGYGSTTGWFANVFTAQANATVRAVGFYTVTPGTTYEVYTGSTLATKTLSSSGTEAAMGYHTVLLSTPVAVTSGQPFVVAVKVTSPGTSWPIAFEAPYANFSSSASAQAGQSYISSSGSSWTDLTTVSGYANANVCLKAYVAPVVPTLTSFAPTSGAVGCSVTLTGIGLSGTTAVAFHGTPATTFVVDSATQIAATVPSGATTGPITVTTPGGTATSTASFTVTAAATSITVTVPPVEGVSWQSGSSPKLGWTLSSAVDVGQFGVWLINQATGTWYTAGYYDALPGETTYTPSCSTLGIPEGSYKAVVYYRSDPGQWVWSANATSPGAATITAPSLAITVTVPPVEGVSWQSGSSPKLGWTLSSAVDVGQFGVWLINQATGTWYTAGYYDALPGETTYTPSCSTLGIPEGSYKAVVYYRSDPGQWVWSANATSPGAATITAPSLAITVTVPPVEGVSWQSGSSPKLGWTLSSAVDVGQFGVWLINQATGTWYTAGYYDALPGETTYTPSCSTLGIPEGSYKAVVYYRSDPGQWVWSANATSPGAATITAPSLAITVTVPPVEGVSWQSGSSPKLGWTLSSAVDVGQFGVWLINQATGTWYTAGYYDALPGETTYTPSCSTLGIPEGSYKAVVYYRSDPGQWVWSANATSPGAANVTV